MSFLSLPVFCHVLCARDEKVTLELAPGTTHLTVEPFQPLLMSPVSMCVCECEQTSEVTAHRDVTEAEFELAAKGSVFS